MRRFSYDFLSRLLISQNPETGTICYGVWSGSNCVNGYDGNGNLLAKTDARNATRSYTYDALNRLTSKVSTFGSVSTANCYLYDVGASNFSGRLSEEWTQPATSCPSSVPPVSSMQTHRLILTYDATGNVTSEQRCVLTSCSTSTPFTLNNAYNLAGNLSAYTTGAGTLAIGNSYNSGGQLSGVTSNIFDATHPASLYNATSFTPGNAPGIFTLGSYLSITRGYDTRLRPLSLTTTEK
jgi:YD repeat-containing protein